MHMVPLWSMYMTLYYPNEIVKKNSVEILFKVVHSKCTPVNGGEFTIQKESIKWNRLRCHQLVWLCGTTIKPNHVNAIHVNGGIDGKNSMDSCSCDIQSISVRVGDLLWSDSCNESMKNIRCVRRQRITEVIYDTKRNNIFQCSSWVYAVHLLLHQESFVFFFIRSGKTQPFLFNAYSLHVCATRLLCLLRVPIFFAASRTIKRIM